MPAAETAHLLAHARLLQDDPRGALREAAGAAPGHLAYAQRIAGRAHMALGDGGNADAAFRRALTASPNDSQVWTDLARFRRSNGDLAGAIEAADRAAAAGPRNVEALILRGELTRGQYGLAAAIPWFDRALEVDSDNVAALLERAATYADRGRMGEMLTDSRKVLQLTDGHPRAYYLQVVLPPARATSPSPGACGTAPTGAYDNTPSGMC